ncbi:MAG TPA: hypothetical protein VN668_16205 [Stellaceae bacterium]|nr:hypothetical protein [Stellaceae bacterium]
MSVDRSLLFHVVVDRARLAILGAVELSATAKVIASVMFAHVNRGVYDATGELECWPSEETLAIEFASSASTVRRARAELRRLGVMSPVNDGGGRKGARYRFSRNWLDAAYAERECRLSERPKRRRACQSQPISAGQRHTASCSAEAGGGAELRPPRGAGSRPDSSEAHLLEDSCSLCSQPRAPRTAAALDFDLTADRLRELIAGTADPPEPEALAKFVGHLMKTFGPAAVENGLDIALDEPRRPRSWATAKGMVLGIMAGQGYPRRGSNFRPTREAFEQPLCEHRVPRSPPPKVDRGQASRAPEPEFPPAPPPGQRRDIGAEARWMIRHGKGPGTPQWSTWALCWGGEEAARQELALQWGADGEIRRELAA